MKKFLSMLLAVMLLLSVSSVAMADTTSYSDMSEVTITKNYELANQGTVSPADTFEFTITRTSVSDSASNVNAQNMPIPTFKNTNTITFAEGDAGSANKSKTITLELPEYQYVGVYIYTIHETAGSTAGVTYYSDDIILKVTVIEQNGKIRVAAVHAESTNNNPLPEGSTKISSFPNMYSAGNLSVTKQVAGILGDQTKAFDFTVKFTKPSGKDVKSTIKVSVAGADATVVNPVWDSNGEYTYDFSLAHGQTATFTNIPYGVSYVVTETGTTSSEVNGETVYTNGDYTVTMTGAPSGSINAATQSVTFTNTKNGAVDTGVSLDSLPYLLMLAVAGAGLVLMIARKRRVQD